MNSDFEVVDPHAEWLELCALATAGALEPAEADRLCSHLADCAQCRTALRQYRTVAREAMPLIAGDYADLKNDWIEIPGWNAAAAKRQLFAQLDTKLDQPSHLPIATPSSPKEFTRRRSLATTGLRIGLGAGLAAGLVIVIGLGGYELGRQTAPIAAPTASPLLGRVQSLMAERMDLDNRLVAENASLDALQKQTTQAQGEVAKLQAQLRESEAPANGASDAKAAVEQQLQAAVADRDGLAAKLEEAQRAYQSVEADLTKVKTQRQQDLLHYASLEVEVSDLTNRLHDAESRVTDENKYLASDRDIRELMGARQLYIADVTDVDPNGNQRKPFGRVFYTKGRSLIFYAFDLDQQPKVKAASTFQAWAREGLDSAKPISLGIFYVDSEANRRWVLKTEDPRVLAQINAVFVTVEPKGGSEKPMGKPLLYAYLRSVSPNHP